MMPQPKVLQAPVVVSSVQDFDALMSRQAAALTLDFSATTLTRPAGMVGLLAVLDWQRRQQNGQRVELLLPHAPPVRANWQAVGLMDALSEFCHWSADPVENMNSAYSPVKLLVNCAHFRDSSAVERMLEEMENRFMSELAGYSSLLQSCCGIFSELTANTIYHADSNGGFALAQYCEYADKPVIELAVADSGIGIRNSLAKNPALVGIDSDCAAIQQAMTEGVTSVGDKYRGLGLAYIADAVQRQQERNLAVRSGNGIITLHGNGEVEAVNTTVAYPGTVISVTIPL